MSGAVDQMCGVAPNVFPPGAIISILGDMLYHLLFYQYIASDHLPARVWQVTEGSGMGLLHSGSIQDAAFVMLLLSAIGQLTLRFKRSTRSLGTLVSNMTVFLGPTYGSVA